MTVKVLALGEMRRRDPHSRGRDSIDRPPNGHDDLANAVAGALVAALAPATPAMLVWIASEYERSRTAGTIG